MLIALAAVRIVLSHTANVVSSKYSTKGVYWGVGFVPDVKRKHRCDHRITNFKDKYCVCNVARSFYCHVRSTDFILMGVILSFGTVYTRTADACKVCLLQWHDSVGRKLLGASGWIAWGVLLGESRDCEDCSSSLCCYYVGATCNKTLRLCTWQGFCSSNKHDRSRYVHYFVRTIPIFNI
jgi:hypothetical protein